MSSRAAPQPVMTNVTSSRTFTMQYKKIIFTEAYLMKNPCTVQTRIPPPGTPCQFASASYTAGTAHTEAAGGGLHGEHIGIGQHSLDGVAMLLEIKVSLSEPHHSMRPRAAGARDDCVAALGIPADRVRPPPLPHPSPIPPPPL